MYIDIIKAVADETRFRILRVLLAAEAALCVAEIVDTVRRPQYAVSRALGILSQAGLVEERQRGKLRLYSPVPGAYNDLVFNLLTAVPENENAWPYDLERLRWRLDLREDGECVVTYTAGYTPAEYKNEEERVTEDEKRKVLFICVHNTARSQMAEAYLHHFGGDILEAESAGLTPGELNRHVVRVMEEDGFDISHKVPQSVFDLYKAGRTYTYVVTVCSREAEEGCPVFPGPVRRLSWPFADPSSFSGSDEEILHQTREVRDQIRERVREFVESYRAGTN